MNLKPFNLERALAGDPVVYRDGSVVLELFYSKVRDKGGKESIITVTDKHGINANYKNGHFLEDESEFLCDLFMAPKKVKYYYASWANTIAAGPGRFCTNMYTSEELLLNTHRMNGRKGKDYIIHEIEIEE